MRYALKEAKCEAFMNSDKEINESFVNKRQNPVLTNRNVIGGKLKRISVHSNVTSKDYQSFNL